MFRSAALIFLCNAAFLGSGCAQLSDRPMVEINGKRYAVEIADTPDSRERGLMFRQEMPAEKGMLFIFEDEEVRSFWMKNTYIPLDILYFDEGRRLVSAQLDVPPCGEQERCPPYPSAGPSKYVLELNAGESNNLNLKPGDLLRIEGVPNLK
jgi:uncharacterized protein